MKTVKQLYILILIIILTSGCSSDEPFDPQAQFELELELIDDYLTEHNVDADIHESGLRYLIENIGNGDVPNLNSIVAVKFTGRLLDETQFDSQELVEFNLSQMIEGWRIGLPLIKGGGSISLYIPSLLGYGVNGLSGQVPPNTPIIFDIILIDVN